MKNDELVDWGSWKNNEIKQLRKFFVEKKYCKDYKDIIDQYFSFFEVVSKFENDKVNLLTTMINGLPKLKKYLQIHSVFSIDARDGDWLNKTMLNILEVTKEDVESAHRPEFIPDEVMKILKIFDPEPISFEVDPIRIEYDFWGFGGPVRIIETDWESINKASVQVESFLSQFQPIDPIVKTKSSYTAEELELLDDCPF
jgi:hypothetical protein